jgi:hypothetical protein
MIESRNVGRTADDFQCRVGIINGLFPAIVFPATQGIVRHGLTASNQNSGSSRQQLRGYETALG